MSRERILVATDLSERSDMAVQKAIALAKKYDLWLEVVHVIDPPFFEWTWGSEHLEEKQKDEERRMEKQRHISAKIQEELNRRHNKVRVETRVGTPYKEIIAFAKEQRVSEIVIGDTGEHHPLRNFFFGSTAKNIIEETHVPVLLARAQGGVDYKRILIPTDFSDDSAEAIRHTAHLFPDAELLLLHVLEIPSETRMRYYGFDDKEISGLTATQRENSTVRMEAFIARLALSQPIKALYAEGALDSEIVLGEGEKLDVDLISLNTHAQAGVTGRIIRNIAEDILQNSSRDVLVYQRG